MTPDLAGAFSDTATNLRACPSSSIQCVAEAILEDEPLWNTSSTEVGPERVENKSVRKHDEVLEVEFCQSDTYWAYTLLCQEASASGQNNHPFDKLSQFQRTLSGSRCQK